MKKMTTLVLLALTALTPLALAQEEDEAAVRGPFAALRYRHIGPPGNRLSAVVGVPGDTNVAYVGGASGGVWKTTDAGVHWRPVFDGQTSQSIGALAIAPSDPNVVWAGTGEAFLRSNVSLGDGIYKSTDAGRSWKNVGLAATGRIARVVIHPKDPNVVFAAAVGHAYGPQQDRGVYRTRDGGKTWQRVLFVDEKTGASDVAMDPTNPDVLFAGTWQIDIKTWGRESGGPGSGVYVSRDGGDTWKRLRRGLPEPPLGKIAVAVAPSNPRRVYALIETGERGSLWRSDDGGESFRVVNHSRLLNERPHYYTRMVVMPDDERELYFPSNGMNVSYDGGETTEPIRWGGDNHDMWVDPLNPSRMLIGNDLGVMMTTTRGREWGWQRLPVAQVYHVAADTRTPYFVYGHMQDYSSLRGPSNSLGFGIHPSLWTTTAGCETGWNIPDPVDPDVVWGGCYAGALERYDGKTGHSRSVSVWPERSMGAPAADLKHRFNWTFPVVLSPHDHERVYVGSQYVNETTDRGETWRQISPDLTLNDESRMGDSGGLTLDNLSVEYYGVVFALAESPLEQGVLWAGTNDGLVQVSRDGGAHWTNVTAAMPGLPAFGTVSSVEPSRHAAGVCYVAVDFHQVNGFDPYLYKTADYGKTWTKIVNGIPKSALSYTHVLREDPLRPGLLYAGTENGVYVSFDDGASWQDLQLNLPRAPVHWIDVPAHFGDLVVGTYGRGIWILDDLSALRQWTPQARAASAHLFEPRPAYRFRRTERRDLAPSGSTAGQNPAYGATLDYLLKAPVEGGATLTIVDAAGETIRTLKGGNREGLNRVVWDLRYEPTQEIALRTIPAGNPHVFEEKRFRGRDSRPISYYGIADPKRGPLVAPGRYTVRLAAGGRTHERSLEVRKDPNTGASLADAMASTKLLVEIWREIDTVVARVNEIEVVREQLEDLRTPLAGHPGRPAILKDADALDAKLRAVEDQLVQRTLAEADEKSFRGPIQLYLKLLWLAAEAGTGGGDVIGSSDHAPTRAQLEVHVLLKQRLAAVEAEYRRVVAEDVAAFNARLQAQGLLNVVVPASAR
ncbi:MAG: WD40/YVTN/BNR-like repeat-containing protein [Vicinamibacteria bacterium]